MARLSARYAQVLGEVVDGNRSLDQLGRLALRGLLSHPRTAVRAFLALTKLRESDLEQWWDLRLPDEVMAYLRDVSADAGEHSQFIDMLLDPHADELTADRLLRRLALDLPTTKALLAFHRLRAVTHVPPHNHLPVAIGAALTVAAFLLKEVPDAVVEQFVADRAWFDVRVFWGGVVAVSGLLLGLGASWRSALRTRRLHAQVEQLLLLCELKAELEAELRGLRRPTRRRSGST